MEHPRDIELIELAAGRVEAAAAGRLRRHVEACPACAARLAEFSRVDAALGRWTVASGGGDIRGRVLDALAARSPETSAAWRPAAGWLPAMRVAAAVAVSVGIGHLAARVTRPDASPPVAATAVEADLFLDTLASGAPAGLADALAEGLLAQEGAP